MTYKCHQHDKKKNGAFETREITWALHNNMIYIDSSVRTGFSFTNNTTCGYYMNQTRIGEHVYSAMTQFIEQLFSNLQKKVFITRESYGYLYPLLPTLFIRKIQKAN